MAISKNLRTANKSKVGKQVIDEREGEQKLYQNPVDISQMRNLSRQF